jgi:hypothetical protein
MNEPEEGAPTDDEIVAMAANELEALGEEVTAEDIKGIIEDAVVRGGSHLACDMIAARLTKAAIDAGINKKAFREHWRATEKEVAARAREAAASTPEMNAEDIKRVRDELRPQVQPLLDDPNILNTMATAVDKLGAAGVEAESKVLYLTGVSSLALRPLSIDAHGPSATGKSYLVSVILSLFPSEARYEFTSASAKVFFYDEEDALRHKIVYAGEASAFYASSKDGDDSSSQAAALIRQLQSDGRVTHRVTVQNADGEHVAKTITREGPIALIVTSTQELHTENATRNLRVHLNETAEQTRKIIDKRMEMRMDPDAAEAVDLERWHALYVYLSYGPRACVVPYAGALGRLIDARNTRLRRDVDALVTAIETHALLNQARREQDYLGRWIATLDDYAAIQPIFDELLAHGREDVLTEGSRRLHAHIVKKLKDQEAANESDASSKPKPHIAPLKKKKAEKEADTVQPGTLTITSRQLAAELGVSKGAIDRHLKELTDLQLVRNLEIRAKQAMQLRIVANIPADGQVSVLPMPDALAAAWEEERRARA